MALDPAGDDLDPVDDLARAGRAAALSAVWPRTTTRGGRRVGAPRPGDGDQADEQAGERRRRSRARPVGSVFGCLNQDLNLQPRSSTGVAAGILPSPPGECTLPARVARSRPRRLCRVAIRDGGLATAADDFIAGGLASLGIEADEIELAVIGAAHQLFWPGDPRPARARPRRARARARPGPLQGARRERARPAAARAGRGDRRRRGRRRRAARRRAGPDRGAQPGDQRRRRDLPGALARDARRRPRGPAARRPGRDQGRVAAALAGAALRRRRNADPDRARRVRPLPRPARRRGGDRRGRQHARGRRQQHRQRLRLRAGPQPLEHRALPGRLLQRPRPPRSARGSSPARSAPTGSARSASRPPTAA